MAITLPWAERDGKKAETINVLMVNQHGDLYTRHSFHSVIWMPAFKRAGLTYVEREDGMHAMRLLFASAMLAQGVTIKELAAYLGHSSEAFTLKTYVHLMPSSHHRARLAVNMMFKPRTQPKSNHDTHDAASQ